jgi:hypothetical protein
VAETPPNKLILTDLVLDQPGNSDQQILQDLCAPFEAITGIRIGGETESGVLPPGQYGFTLCADNGNDPPLPGDPPIPYNVDKNQMMREVFKGTANGGLADFAWGSANRHPTGGDEFLFAHLFGMEVQEYCAWWYAGGGKELIEAQTALLESPFGGGAVVPAPSANNLDALTQAEDDYGTGNNKATSPRDIIMFPVATRGPESGCWSKEALTFKKLAYGKFSDGTQVRMRLADEAKPAHGYAFPNCPLPGTIATVTFLGQIVSGDITACEFNEPIGDSNRAAAVTPQPNTLFPNWPSPTGSVVQYLRHYYLGSWHTPYRGRCLFVNKTYFEETLTAQEQAALVACATAAHMNQMADSLQEADTVLKIWQDMGAIIHESLPRDVLLALREATDEIYHVWSEGLPGAPSDLVDTDGFTYGAQQTAQYKEVLDHQRAFMRDNQVRWRSGCVDRRFRTQGRPNYNGTLQPDVKF